MDKKFLVPSIIGVLLLLVVVGGFFIFRHNSNKTVGIQTSSQEESVAENQNNPTGIATDQTNQIANNESGLTLTQTSESNYSGGTFAAVELPATATDEEKKTAIINSMSNAYFNGISDQTVDQILTAAYILNGYWGASFGVDGALLATYTGTNPANENSSVLFIVDLASGTFKTAYATQGEKTINSGADFIQAILSANYSN